VVSTVVSDCDMCNLRGNFENLVNRTAQRSDNSLVEMILLLAYTTWHVWPQGFIPATQTACGSLLGLLMTSRR